ncbi:MAG: hypothetical protein ABSC94_09425 [Polyangiaceae bacterium]
MMLGLCGGCLVPPTPLARAQETTQEFNLDTRFGRLESAIEHVAPSAREEYATRHKAWGSGVRIAELEVAGMRPKGEHDVEVIVRVSWYRPEQEELRTTTLAQKWHEKGGWQLVAEDRVDGDAGLLGDPVVFQAPPSGPAQFPTIRLGGAAD